MENLLGRKHTNWCCYWLESSWSTNIIKFNTNHLILQTTFIQRESAFINQEMKYLNSQCIKKCNFEEHYFKSPINVVPKRDTFRLVVDLCLLNKHISDPKFWNEDTDDVLVILELSNYMVTLDRKVFFPHSCMRRTFYIYLCFRWQKTIYIYRYYDHLVQIYLLTILPSL